MQHKQFAAVHPTLARSGQMIENQYTNRMIIDGKQVAAAVLAEVAMMVASLPTTPVLTAFTSAPNFETQKFLALKKRKAAEVGITLRVIEFSDEVTVPEMVLSIQAAHAKSAGIIVQLPFPARIDIEEVLPAIAPTHDVDVFTYDGSVTNILPPVAGAVATLCTQYSIPLAGAKVLVVGQGRLVGVPVALYMRAKGASVTVVTKDSGKDLTALALAADIIVTGAGVPNLITSDMVSPGTVVFDAGTSESNGTLVGDVNPSTADKCRLFTPVPGGLGPIAVAALLQNVALLAAAQIEKT